MDISLLKRYAQSARRDFMAAVRERAAKIMGGAAGEAARALLAGEIERCGIAEVVERHACFWFNRFAALRYLELHGYLERRVFGGGQDGAPAVLAEALHVSFPPPFDPAYVRGLLGAGNREEELYRHLLLSQCEALAGAMPLLFDRVAGMAALLLPDGLLHSDSLLRRLVSLGEEPWKEGVEIIGWLYQFYVAERRGEIAGKVVSLPDLPAATQLFTPNWIARYLIQHTLGRKVMELGQGRLESLRVLDPACGSGHLLVEAYRLLRSAYLERGYPRRALPAVILGSNLWGLDIDQRAAQLAAFSLTMEAAQDNKEVVQGAGAARLNVMALRQSSLVNGAEDKEGAELSALFREIQMAGSLVRVPPAALERIQTPQETALAGQARALGALYDCVVANPPYLSTRFMDDSLKRYARANYPDSRADLFSMFMERCLEFSKPDGLVGMLTMHSWMFLPSYRRLREKLLSRHGIISLLHLGPRAFRSVSGEVVQTCAFVLGKGAKGRGPALFYDLTRGDEEAKRRAFESAVPKQVCQEEFETLPGAVLAYWLSPKVAALFRGTGRLSDIAEVRQGIATGDNARFLRLWYEVSPAGIAHEARSVAEARACGKRWFPYNKGGGRRAWYGNHDYVISFDEGSEEALLKSGNRLPARRYYLKAGVTWSLLASSGISARVLEPGFLFDVNGMAAFPRRETDRLALLGLLSSRVSDELLRAINPTLAFQAGNVREMPLPAGVFERCRPEAEKAAAEAAALSREEWDEHEISWDFQGSPLVSERFKRGDLESSCLAFERGCTERAARVRELGRENDRIFIEGYGLQDELSPRGSFEGGGTFTWDRTRIIKDFISYGVGCLIGRYRSGETEGALARDGILPLGHETPRLWLELLRTFWPEASAEEGLRFMVSALKAAPGEAPSALIERYLCNDFFEEHLRLYRKRPIYWLVWSGEERAFQALLYMHRYHGGTLSELRTSYVLPAMARLHHLQRQAPEAEGGGQRRDAEKLRRMELELSQFDERLHALAERRIEMDLDLGVAANYHRLADILCPLGA
jgi:hypothetical protein